MTGKRFADWAGIKYQTLCGWLQRRRQAADGQQPVGGGAQMSGGWKRGCWRDARPASRGGCWWCNCEVERGWRLAIRLRGVGCRGVAQLVAAEGEGKTGRAEFHRTLRIFVALESCDMRKGFNGLLALVSERLGKMYAGERSSSLPIVGIRG